jgi:hypothetical protein
VALGETGMSALQTPVGELHRTEEDLFEGVGVGVGKLLVGDPQSGEPGSEPLGRLGDGLEQLLARLAGHI